MEVIKGDITKISSVQAIVNVIYLNELADDVDDRGNNYNAKSHVLRKGRFSDDSGISCVGIRKKCNLPYQYEIYIECSNLSNENVMQLANCYYDVLQLAVDYNIRTIAFPSISIDSNKVALFKEALVAVVTLKDFFKKNPGKIKLVQWVLQDDEAYDEYKRMLKEN